MGMHRIITVMLGIKVGMDEWSLDVWEDEYLESLMDVVENGISIVTGGEGDNDSLYIGRVLTQFNDYDYDQKTITRNVRTVDKLRIAKEISDVFKDYDFPTVYTKDIKLITVVSWE